MRTVLRRVVAAAGGVERGGFLGVGAGLEGVEGRAHVAHRGVLREVVVGDEGEEEGGVDGRAIYFLAGKERSARLCESSGVLRPYLKTRDLVIHRQILGFLILDPG